MVSQFAVEILTFSLIAAVVAAGLLLAFEQPIASIFSIVSLYLLQRLQGWLPFNPMGFGTAHAPQTCSSTFNGGV